MPWGLPAQQPSAPAPALQRAAARRVKKRQTAQVVSRTANVPGQLASVERIPAARRSSPQPTTGATAVRRLTQSDVNVGLGQSQGAAQRAQARAGHRFRILVKEDGSIVHQYGKDVAPELRNVTLKPRPKRAPLGAATTRARRAGL